MVNNGCCATQRTDRLASFAGDRTETKSDAEAAYEATPATYNACDSDLLRTKPGAVLDLVQTGRTVEIYAGLAPNRDPIAVMLPWSEYSGLIAMRDKIHAITGGMQRAG